MSEREIQQLVEMGATAAQARAALRQHKDVMTAAERIFEGKFDHIIDTDEDLQPTPRSRRPATPDEDEDEDEIMADDDDDEAEDYIDYDSDYETPTTMQTKTLVDADPYAGIFYSKDRKEEVIEVEEEPEHARLPDLHDRVSLMTQGEWMKGCPEGGEQSFLFQLYSELCQGKCSCPQGCDFSIAREKSDFFALLSDFSTYINRLERVVRKTCPKCLTDFCFACGETINSEKANKGGPDSNKILFHCSNLQGVILGVGLSMIEQTFSEQTRASAKSNDLNDGARISKRRKTGSAAAKEIDDEDDLYYANLKTAKGKGGIGYAGDQKEDHSGYLEAMALQHAKDEKLGKLLTAVREYLPSLRRPGGGRTSDYLVHPTALAHLRRRFNFVCSTLLRNDSLADMSERSILYFELLEWLETISNHEALASMMAMPIMAVASVKATTVRKTKDNTSVRERTVIYEGSSSPRELLEGIALQARGALKGLESTKQPEETPEELTEDQKRMTIDLKGKSKQNANMEDLDENLKLSSFCNRILATTNAIDKSLRETKGDAFVERLQSSFPTIFTSSTAAESVSVSPGASEEVARKTYLDWATKVRFEYCDLTVPNDPPNKGESEDQPPHFKFFFDNEARMLANADIPKRSLAIAKELAILTTNLPVAWDSSIFLRVDETRVDVIKALITGPEGTPYHNGCYLFDIFLGPSYNQSPPNVKYMTTNGGKYRFNPNLYADGKVCLSLLGTWSGPGWVSGKSTLLQVLISIQSMILCDEPYLNEPGWASSAGTPQSHAYSANVRRMVVRTAMLGNLRNPPEPFAAVVRTHYRLKANSIRAQLDQWLAQDDGRQISGDGAAYSMSTKLEGGSNTNGFRKDVEELKQILNDLENEKI